MRIEWLVESEDIQRVQEFINLHSDNRFVQGRIEKNVRSDKVKPTREEFWFVMVSCLLTTQQRSAPKSSVSRFIDTKPFPLRYEKCLRQDDLVNFARNTLVGFGGIRRTNIIPAEIDTNLKKLESDYWRVTFLELDRLIPTSTPQVEREAAEFISRNFKGFGPKQSRNLLQDLGLTKYEIPLDSRITKWLNDFGFPIKLSATALYDQNYYNFVSEGFQELCAMSDIYPCVLDAAIFSSYDKGGWS
jgi:thermostable 8-oxoguanine DNA glycosylase